MVLRACIVGLVLVPTHTASASLIVDDFNDVALHTPMMSLERQGVLYSAVDGGPFTADETPNATIGLLGNTFPPSLPRFSKIRAEISGGASRVVVDLGDYNADPDLLVLECFGGQGQLLGRSELLVDDEFEGMLTLEVEAPGIAYAVFGSELPSFSGSSVYADNFGYVAVPGAGSAGWLCVALPMLAGRRRRRSPE